MNRNMKLIPNFFNHKILRIKLGVKELQCAKFYAILLVLVMLVGIFSIPAISTLVHSVVIRSSGKIGTGYIVTANSGSAKDIQVAVDEVVAAGGIGDVHIPAGTFNFVEVGESWMTVNVPAGVNVFGAPTERDANGQVIEWKTILIMPYEAPTGSTWFSVQGNGDPDVGFRFSDIKLVGWRFFDSSSTTMYTGVWIDEVQNFRIDHCHFQDMAGSAVWIWGWPMRSYNHDKICGVIDHCRLVNTYGNPGVVYEDRTLGYGIGIRRWACDLWDNLQDVIGHYTDHTIFIEDNYFSRWRHGFCSNDGTHVVFRHNTVEKDYAMGMVDSHGSYADADHPYAVGTRAIEVYNNIFSDPDLTWYPPTWNTAIQHRGGAGIITNNKVEGYQSLLRLMPNNDWGNAINPHCKTWDTYIWGNDLGMNTNVEPQTPVVLIGYNDGSTENEMHFLRPPSLEQDGWEYTPYPYPHPLTLG